MPPPTLSDLIFLSDQAASAGGGSGPSLSRVLGDLRRSNLSIANRLRSIREDAAFVAEVAAALDEDRRRDRDQDQSENEDGRGEGPGPLPIVANERCGSWYVPPGRKAASAYFKSTDGHTGQWKFSARRLNLHLLELIGRCDGCILVDSTRRGKSMPDALSKTLPIWCCVLNRALFPSLPATHHALFVPSGVVSASERSQIEARVPGFVAAFRALAIDLPALLRRGGLRKPLRPVWVTRGGSSSSDFFYEYDDGDDDDDEGDGDGDGGAPLRDFHPIVCCTSSRRAASEKGGGGADMIETGEGYGYGYVQGAADDTEHWALGLTAPLFWAHVDELLAAPEHDLPGLIAELVARAAASSGQGQAVLTEEGEGEGGEEGRIHSETQQPKGLTRSLFVAPLSIINVGTETFPPPGTCLLTFVPRLTDRSAWRISKSHMEIGLGKSKLASRTLRDALPEVCDFVAQFLERTGEGESEGSDDCSSPPPRIVIACESGKDLSVGVALALSCWLFDDDEENVKVKVAGERRSFTKAMIRIKLGRIMMAMPEANPSRATLQSVNSFLMDWQR